jgi:hypothetical protein
VIGRVGLIAARGYALGRSGAARKNAVLDTWGRIPLSARSHSSCGLAGVETRLRRSFVKGLSGLWLGLVAVTPWTIRDAYEVRKVHPDANRLWPSSLGGVSERSVSERPPGRY